MYDDELLLEQIQHDEGRSATVYKDTKGLWTIADGILVDRTIPGAGLLPEEMDFITSNRIRIATNATIRIVGADTWLKLAPARRRALTNMCYNLGEAKLRLFKQALFAVVKGDWSAAAVALEDSVWYNEVGDRAKRIIKEIQTGEDQPTC